MTRYNDDVWTTTEADAARHEEAHAPTPLEDALARGYEPDAPDRPAHRTGPHDELIARLAREIEAERAAVERRARETHSEPFREVQQEIAERRAG